MVICKYNSGPQTLSARYCLIGCKCVEMFSLMLILIIGKRLVNAFLKSSKTSYF